MNWSGLTNGNQFEVLQLVEWTDGIFSSIFSRAYRSHNLASKMARHSINTMGSTNQSQIDRLSHVPTVIFCWGHKCGHLIHMIIMNICALYEQINLSRVIFEI